MNIALF